MARGTQWPFESTEIADSFWTTVIGQKSVISANIKILILEVWDPLVSSYFAYHLSALLCVYRLDVRNCIILNQTCLDHLVLYLDTQMQTTKWIIQKQIQIQTKMQGSK